jgi:hypothetical protein
MQESGLWNKAVVYLAHCDRDLTLMPRQGGLIEQAERLRISLTLHALFYEHAIVFDSGVLYNEPLRAVLTSPRFRPFGLDRLVTEGFVVPAHRDVAPTFVELERLLRATGTYEPPAPRVSVPFAEFLDQAPDAVFSSQDDVYGVFTALTARALTDEQLMAQVGLSAVAPDALDYFRSRSASFGGHIRRTFYYEYARRCASRGTAQALREFGSALSTEAYARLLGAAVAYPDQYERTIRAVYDIPFGLPDPDMVEVSLASGQEAAVLDRDVVGALDFDVVSDIRRGKPFRSWIAAFKAAQAEADPVIAAVELERAFATYCTELEEPLALAYDGVFKRERRQRTLLRINRVSGAAGGVTLGIVGMTVGAAAVPAGVIGVVWALGATGVDRLLDRSSRRLLDGAKGRVHHERIVSSADSRITMPSLAVARRSKVRG